MVEFAPTFTVHRRLGRGGMGEVFLATMSGGDGPKLVALKRMRAEFAETDSASMAFEREARICSLLKHRHIVALEGFGKDERGPFLALEFVDGRTASELVQWANRMHEFLPEEVVWQVMLDVATGLQFAHGVHREDSAAIIHRDLTPDNILVAKDGVAKLSDFGIAKLAGGTSFTTTGMVKGKHGYLAPELFDGHEAHTASDYFALASTLYRLWCGVLPFHGRTEAELVRAVLQAEPAPINSLRPGVPPGVEIWVQRALLKDPEQRPKGLEQLIDALREAVGPKGARNKVTELLKRLPPPASVPNPVSEPVPSRATATHGVAVATPRKSRAGRQLALVVVASLLAIVGLAGAVTYYESQTTSSGPQPGRADAARGPVAPPAPIGTGDVPAAAVDVAVATQPSPTAMAPELPAHTREVDTAQPSPGSGAQVAPPSTVKKESPKVENSPAEAARASKGQLWVKVRPWGRVFVDGKLWGPTPLPAAPLALGKHQVIVVNEELKAQRSYSVEIRPGRTTELKVVLP